MLIVEELSSGHRSAHTLRTLENQLPVTRLADGIAEYDGAEFGEEGFQGQIISVPWEALNVELSRGDIRHGGCGAISVPECNKLGTLMETRTNRG